MSMQSQFQLEQNEAERRYRPETVQKAAALAARLQEDRRGTLSQAEVDEMAAEIGIDPKLMRQALDTVAQSEAATVAPTRSRGSLVPLGIACIASGFFLVFLILIFWLRQSASVSSPMSMPMTPPVEAGTLVSGPLIQNGSFESGAPASTKAQKLSPGSRSLPGWTVSAGEVLRLPTTSVPGGHAIQLGENGGIQQLIPTVPNQTYRVTLSLSGQPGEIRRFHRVLVQTSNTSATPSIFTEAGTGITKWEQRSFEFRAENDATLLTFTPGPNDELGPGVPIIDNVSVESLGVLPR